MAEILHFEILRKHGQTNRHGHYNTSPSPYGGRGNNRQTNKHTEILAYYDIDRFVKFVSNK